MEKCLLLFSEMEEGWDIGMFKRKFESERKRTTRKRRDTKHVKHDSQSIKGGPFISQ